MAETRFMKTVTYGGYNKDDVIKQITLLNLQVAELKNQLSEANYLLNAYKTGSDIESAYQAAMSNERTMLSESQAINETYEARINYYETEMASKDAEIKSLQEAVSEVSQGLEDANAKISALQSGDDASALSSVFIEAQKSANSLKTAAKMEADKIKEEAMSLAESIVIEANNEAAQIVYEAEKTAAITTTDAQNNVEQMNVATNNMRVAMLEDIAGLNNEMRNIKTMLEAFSRNGLAELEKAANLLGGTESTLKSGGVPKFQQAKTYSPKLPSEPKPTPLPNRNAKPAQPAQPAEEKKKNNGLDKLQQMANSINGDSNKKNGGGINLDGLKKQAESLGGTKKPVKGGVDLAALQKQAESLGKKK